MFLRRLFAVYAGHIKSMSKSGVVPRNIFFTLSDLSILYIANRWEESSKEYISCMWEKAITFGRKCACPITDSRSVRGWHGEERRRNGKELKEEKDRNRDKILLVSSLFVIHLVWVNVAMHIKFKILQADIFCSSDFLSLAGRNISCSAERTWNLETRWFCFSCNLYMFRFEGNNQSKICP